MSVHAAVECATWVPDHGAAEAKLAIASASGEFQPVIGRLAAAALSKNADVTANAAR
jgi:hypothetical protein